MADFEQLPIATQMLLDPQSTLSPSLLQAWAAACRACVEDAAAATSGSSASTAAQLPPHAAARRGPKRLVDTHDFFALSEALDTLTDELRTSGGGGGKGSVASVPCSGGAQGSGAARARIGVDELDTRRDPTQSDEQAAAVRDAVAAFRLGQYKPALELLLHASSLCLSHELTAPLLHNVAVCYFKLEQWDLCSSATQRVMSVDTAGVYPSLQRLARVHICQGSSEEAQRCVAAHRDDVAWKDEVAAARAFIAYTNFYATHQYGRARESLEAVLAVLPCGTLEATKARLLSLDSVGAAAHYAQQQAARYSSSAEMQMAAAELAFQAATSTADLDALVAVMQRATVGVAELRFRLLQTHVARCRDAIVKLATLTQARKWADVEACATQTLREPFVSDGVKGMVYHDRARARVQLRSSWYEALDDSHRALSYTEKKELRAELLLLVARSEEALGRLQDALGHAEESCVLQRSAATEGYVRRLRERRAQEQRKAQPSHGQSSSAKDTRQEQQQQQHAGTSPSSVCASALKGHYETLGLRSGADAAAVRKSYRALAMKWHPDRWCGAAAEDIASAETRFKAIQDAYEKLMQGLV